MSGNERGQGRRVLIAGGTGYVGEHVREAVRERGYAVRLLVRSRDEAQALEAAGFETALGDVLDAQSLFVAMDGVDAVINLVAIIKESGDATFERINFEGTAHLVDAARQAGVERFIQMSALGADDLPDYPYHFTKWRAENYVKDRMPAWTIMRPSIVFGPSPGRHVQFASQLADVIRKAPIIPIAGDGQARFQPIHVSDVAAAFATALDEPATIGRTYELGGPDILTYREMVDEIAAVLGVGRPKVNVPIPLIRLGIAIMKPLPFMEPPVTNEQLAMLQLENFPAGGNDAPALIGRPLTPFKGNLDYLRDYSD